MAAIERAELVELVQAVAEELGAGWTVDAPEGYRGVYLVELEDGLERRRVFVAPQWSGGRQGERRLELTGSPWTLPRDLYVRDVDLRPEITAAADKGAGKLAGDVRRRLLPELDAANRATLEAVESAAWAEKGRRETFDRMAELFGHDSSSVEWEHAQRSGRGPRVSVYRSGGIIGDVEPSWDGRTVAFDVKGVPVEVAERMAAVLVEALEADAERARQERARAVAASVAERHGLEGAGR